MRNKALLLTLIGLIMGSFSLCDAAYVVRVKDTNPIASYLPQVTKDRQKRFKAICKRTGDPCKRFGSPRILEAQNNGRYWPKQRRKLTHKVLAKLEEELKAFPPAQRKLQAIKNLEKRVKQFRIIR